MQWSFFMSILSRAGPRFSRFSRVWDKKKKKIALAKISDQFLCFIFVWNFRPLQSLLPLIRNVRLIYDVNFFCFNANLIINSSYEGVFRQTHPLKANLVNENAHNFMMCVYIYIYNEWRMVLGDADGSGILIGNR